METNKLIQQTSTSATVQIAKQDKAQDVMYAPPTEKTDIATDEAGELTEKENNHDPSCKGYQYSKDIIKEVSLPDGLVPLLPDPDLIIITGIAKTESISTGQVYFKNGLYEPMIAYDPRYVKNYIEGVKIAKLTFLKSIHPFLRLYTSDIISCAEKLYNILNTLGRVGITNDIMQAEFTDNGICDNNWYIETPDYIKYETSYMESYHDGGGCGSEEWWLYGTTDISIGQELQQGKYLDNGIVEGFQLPEHNGYWIEDEHCYIVNPFGLPGIFEYYCKIIDQYDYESSEKVFEIGVRFGLK